VTASPVATDRPAAKNLRSPPFLGGLMMIAVASGGYLGGSISRRAVPQQCRSPRHRFRSSPRPSILNCVQCSIGPYRGCARTSRSACPAYWLQWHMRRCLAPMLPVHSFHTLLGDLATLTRNVVRLGRDRLTAILATPPAPHPAPRPRSSRRHAHRVDRPTTTVANYINGLRSKAGKVRLKTRRCGLDAIATPEFHTWPAASFLWFGT